MNTTVHNRLVSFIWSIADDCLRDVYVRGKYRDVILPMVVLRRLDALLEPSKEAVLEELAFQRNELGFTDTTLDKKGLEEASGYVFYNTSEWTLKKLHSTVSNSQQILEANFLAYLNGFSENVKEIIDKFKLKSQIKHMAAKDVLFDVLEKFTSPSINLTPFEQEDPDGRKLPALTNLGMGYVFEELIRRFNEENNEEAGEHFTPREVIDLMTHLVFDPLKDQLPPVMTIYDPACGSGGMLTEAQNFIKDEEGSIRATGDVYLYGKEINDETYAICKSDMMIKGNNPENIRLGSTLSTNEFGGKQFDFMLSNPPYGKSWNSEVRYIKDGKDIIDPRFQVVLPDYWGEAQEEDATPRTSDGQLLFLMEMVDKMKAPDQNGLGSRIASVHNGSSLFTGDAGSGESNIRRYLIEHDLLDAIIQLPNNLFYNTGITTYIWLLSNHKPAHRRGKVLLIDASQRYRKLRKNLGAKNCEFAPEHIAEIVQAYLAHAPRARETEDGLAVQVFDNQDFGYYKVSIERPKRLKAQLRPDLIAELRYDKSLRDPMQWAWETYGERVYTELPRLQDALLQWCEAQELDLSKKQRLDLTNPQRWQQQRHLLEVAEALRQAIGEAEYDDFNRFRKEVDAALRSLGEKLTTPQKKTLLQAVSWYDATAHKVIDKRLKLEGRDLARLLTRLGCTEADLPDFGYYPTGKPGTYLTYERETELRDAENVPLKDDIHAFFRREVKPHVPEAWINLDSVKIGYEISFNKYFYQHKPLRSLAEVTADILAVEQESEGLIRELLGIPENLNREA